jgi:TolB-like protein/Tfp pilus assembly protein PilF
MPARARLIYEFGRFRLDAGQRQLYTDAGREPIALTARVFDTLLYLVEHHGELLEKRTLIRAVWPNVVVEENNLNQNISTLRRALGEVPGEHRFILTVPGRGYRFVAEVRTLPATQPTPVAAPPPASDDSAMLSTALCVPRASIAVVPFANLTGDPSKEYLSDGLAEELIHVLCRIAGLKVPSRTSSFAYKGRQIDVRQIASDLGVEAVLEGSVRSAGERLRVTAQLVDAQTGYHRWSQSYDRKFEDLFALQDDLAQAIALAVQPSLPPVGSATQARPTPDLGAYQRYLQASSLLHFPTAANMRHALDLLQEVKTRDPRFARAFARLAYLRMWMLAPFSPQQNTPADAEHEAAHALSIDPSLAEAHAALGMYHADRGNWSEAETRFRVGLTLPDADALATGAYVMRFLLPVGYLREALRYAKEYQRLAPASPNSWRVVGSVYWALGFDSEAQRYADAAAELGLDRHDPPMAMIYAAAATRAGRHAEAAVFMSACLPAAVREAGGAEAATRVAAAIENTATRDAAIDAIDAVLNRYGGEHMGQGAAWTLLGWYVRVGAIDRAFAIATTTLDRLARAGAVGPTWAAFWLPEMRAFRLDPRFQNIVARLRLVPYWEKHAAPDGCELRDGKLICQ